MDFTKFPKLSHQQRSVMPAGGYTVQEKLDGSQAGIQLIRDGYVGILLIHSRRVHIATVTVNMFNRIGDTVQEAEYGSFGGLVRNVEANAVEIYNKMIQYDLSHIYGEWLTPHTLQYEEGQYQRFYPFDAVAREGVFIPVPLGMLVPGWSHVPAVKVNLPECPTQAMIQDAVEQVAKVSAVVQRPRIEGVVFKRYAYKFVLEDFREDHARNSMFPQSEVRPTETPEAQLLSAMSDRSIEKVYQKVVDSEGGWNNKLIPKLINMCWQELFEEHMIQALKKAKQRVIDFNQLKTLHDRRVAGFALAKGQQ